MVLIEWMLSDRVREGSSVAPVLQFRVKLLSMRTSVRGGRCRPNTVLATAYDLRVFFTIVGLAPEEVTSREVLAS